MPTGIPGTTTNPLCHPERKLRGMGLCGRCYDKKYRETNKDTRDGRERSVKVRHNIPLEEYLILREKQRNEGNLCGVCLLPLTEIPKPNLDHCHVTGKLRDFLHGHCNMALGLLKDDSKICRQAAEYLERHQAVPRGE